MTAVVADKKCSRCGESKPLSEFCKMHTSPDGFGYVCKPCNREVSRSRYRNKKDQALAYMRDYRAKIKAKVVEHYGGCCAECGSCEELTLDHVNGDGERHRTELFGGSRASGHALRQALVASDFDTQYELQLLCVPCHKSKTAKGHG